MKNYTLCYLIYNGFRVGSITPASLPIIDHAHSDTKCCFDELCRGCMNITTIILARKATGV